MDESILLVPDVGDMLRVAIISAVAKSAFGKPNIRQQDVRHRQLEPLRRTCRVLYQEVHMQLWLLQKHGKQRWIERSQAHYRMEGYDASHDSWIEVSSSFGHDQELLQQPFVLQQRMLQPFVHIERVSDIRDQFKRLGLTRSTPSAPHTLLTLTDEQLAALRSHVVPRLACSQQQAQHPDAIATLPRELPSAIPELPASFEAQLSEMPPPLRALLVENAPPASVCAEALAASLPSLPLGMPMGGASDAMTVARLLSEPACASLRASVDAASETARDTVDGASDFQHNLSAEDLAELIGSEAVERLLTAGRQLDRQRGGSGTRPLPLVEAFVRRYTPETRPWHPFHQDRAAVTVNVALSADAEHGGGRLLALFGSGAHAFERACGDATVHLSRIVHGVTRMTHGVRYALIVFLGDEPPVRRELVTTDGPSGPVQEWTRVVVEP